MTRFGPWLLSGSTLTHPGGCVIVPAQVERISEALDAIYYWDLTLLDGVYLARALEEIAARRVAAVTDGEVAA